MAGAATVGLGVASLGMYDMPWVAACNDAIWAGLRRRLREADVAGVPEALERTVPPRQIWRAPNLLLAQICGYPLLALGDAVQLVATPVYDIQGCKGPFYRSLVVVADRVAADSVRELRGLRAAVNEWNSNSGMNTFRAAVAPHAGGRPFFAKVVTTGGHMLSLAALREGRADVAAIDCVTYGLTARHRPDLLAGTRVIEETAATPGLPLVTAAATPARTLAALQRALRGVLADPALAWPRAGLGLAGFANVPRDRYATIADLEREAEALGYPALA